MVITCDEFDTAILCSASITVDRRRRRVDSGVAESKRWPATLRATAGFGRRSQHPDVPPRAVKAHRNDPGAKKPRTGARESLNLPITIPIRVMSAHDDRRALGEPSTPAATTPLSASALVYPSFRAGGVRPALSVSAGLYLNHRDLLYGAAVTASSEQWAQRSSNSRRFARSRRHGQRTPSNDVFDSRDGRFASMQPFDVSRNSATGWPKVTRRSPPTSALTWTATWRSSPAMDTIIINANA